jgi:glycosyltransferase involved in cell wall biosynthesis
MVHRVDGPIGAYRGFDDGTDRQIEAINRELADATIVQSRYSLDAHGALGIELRAPEVVRNSVDPSIFHPLGEREPLLGRKIRVVAVSWSDNPNKGTDVFAWLDEHLDWERYEMTFVGRSQEPFRRIRAVGAVRTEAVADELRRHDVYLAPSVNDPCSNALLEALACGLPAAFRSSGGHPELVGDAGLPFEHADELAPVLDRLVEQLDERRASIRIPLLAEVADRYLEILRG